VAAVIWLVEKRAHRFTDKAFELKEADRKEWTIMLAKSLAWGVIGALALTLIVMGVVTIDARAQDESELAKQTQNPVSDLISVPFQNNFNFGAGSNDKMIYVLNIQPVVPFHLTDNWNLITRTIMPVINQPSLFPGMDSATGLGDINPTFFLSPRKPGSVIWGVGPTFTLPTASDPLLGSGKWSMGPAGVILTMQGPWVLGALLNNQWSVGGWGDNNVNAGLLQPFINYNFPGGWYLSSAPIITVNWKADRGERWTVPLGGGGGKLFKIGKLPVNVNVQAFGNVERPRYAPDWSLRFQVQLLLPK
jgi:hypothetical protein